MKNTLFWSKLLMILAISPSVCAIEEEDYTLRIQMQHKARMHLEDGEYEKAIIVCESLLKTTSSNICLGIIKDAKRGLKWRSPECNKAQIRRAYCNNEKMIKVIESQLLTNPGSFNNQRSLKNTLGKLVLFQINNTDKMKNQGIELKSLDCKEVIENDPITEACHIKEEP